MARYGVPQFALTIPLHGGPYLAIIIDRHEGPLTSLTIALHRGLLLAIIMDRHEGPKLHLLKPCIEAST
jgi:hypothetical protein